MTEKDIIPLKMMDGMGYCELKTYVELGHCVPSRDTITSRTERLQWEKRRANYAAGFFDNELLGCMNFRVRYCDMTSSPALQ